MGINGNTINNKKSILGCRQAVTASVFDTDMRWFKSSHPSHSCEFLLSVFSFLNDSIQLPVPEQGYGEQSRETGKSRCGSVGRVRGLGP